MPVGMRLLLSSVESSGVTVVEADKKGRDVAMARDRDEFDEAPKPEAKRPCPGEGEGASSPGGADEGYSTFRPSPLGEPVARNPQPGQVDGFKTAARSRQ